MFTDKKKQSCYRLLDLLSLVATWQNVHWQGNFFLHFRNLGGNKGFLAVHSKNWLIVFIFSCHVLSHDF